MSIPLLDAFPYPWALREAQMLHIALCELYPSSKAAMFVAERAGHQPWNFNLDQPAYLLWRDILGAGATARSNRVLVQVARDEKPTSPRAPFFEAMLASRDCAVDAEPRGPDGAPSFIVSTDQVTEPEALLFHDDLSLEVGRVPALIDTLRMLLTISPAVCLLRVRGPAGEQTGTGFRIADDLLLTNWHVARVLGQPATAITAEFGFEDDGRGGGLASQTFPCDPAHVAGDQSDDWAVVRVSAALPPTVPVLPLSSAAAPSLQAQAFILQHPGGQRKRLAFVRNQVTGVDARIVHYLSDTQQGSSGSPVLDAQGRLIALHHAGGRPQEVAGRPPLRKNEGIRIERVQAGALAAGLALP